MKILITGATGQIGTEVLEQCIAHNYVREIYCLVRKPLAEKYSTHRKVTQIIHEDFSQYPQHLLDKLANYGIEGCIWALGAKGTRYATKEEGERVGIHYPIQAANAFASSLATELDPNAPPNKQKFPFRFVFMSGWGAEQNQFRSLWLWADSRKINGAAEKGVFDVADSCALIDGKRCFEAIALRVCMQIKPLRLDGITTDNSTFLYQAGGVLPKGDATTTLLSESVAPYIAVDRLAKSAIKRVMQGTGYEGKRILENAELLGDDWGLINSLTI